MGTIRKPAPVKLFVGVLFSLPDLLPAIESELTALFGPIDQPSDIFPFEDTRYYDKEMGTPIQRRFFSFAGLIPADTIASVKIRTNALEESFASKQPAVTRPVNLDPGYVELSKIVLASTKNFYHRLLISDGIYAEVTQYFEGGRWRCLPWTYPDFRSGRYDGFFVSIRSTYQNQLRNLPKEEK